MKSRKLFFFFVYFIFLLLYPLSSLSNQTNTPSYIDFSTKNYFFWEGKYVSAVVLWLEPQDGFYLYSHKEVQGKPTIISVVSGKTEVKDVEIFYPEGEIIRDKLDPSKRVSVYDKKVPVVILLPRSLIGRTIYIRTEGLVCSDTLCMPLRALAQITIQEPSDLTNIKDEKWFNELAPAFNAMFANNLARKIAFDTVPVVRKKSEPKTKIIEENQSSVKSIGSLEEIEKEILNSNKTKDSLFGIKKQTDTPKNKTIAGISDDTKSSTMRNPFSGMKETIDSFISNNKKPPNNKAHVEKKFERVQEKRKEPFRENKNSISPERKELRQQRSASHEEALQKQQIEILMQQKMLERKQGKQKTKQEIIRDKELAYQMALEKGAWKREQAQKKENWKEEAIQKKENVKSSSDDNWQDAIKNIFASVEDTTKHTIFGKEEISQVVVKEKTTLSKEAQLWKFTPRYVQEVFEVGTLSKGLLFAFLAGFILNFMPCVFPIITLKFSSLLGIISKRGSSLDEEYERGQSIHIFRVYNVFYSLGVMSFFALLGFLMYSTGAVWGRIFQIPEAMLVIASVVFLLALSIFGVFDIPIFNIRISSAGTATYQAFMTGMLTTLLATPCSAPLLGGVLSWLVQQPPSYMMLVLMTMSFGMIIPYILFIIFPRLITKLPRPGRWNIILEALVAFFLIGTTIYLLSLLPQLWLFPSIIILFMLAFGAWVWGKTTGYAYTAIRNLSIRVIIIFILSGLIYWVLQPSPVTSWEPFNKKGFNALLSKETLLVNFTADWCPNCKVLEQTVLTPENLTRWKKEYGVRLIVVDLTRENKDGEALLASLKSNSIPLLAIFPKHRSAENPLVLRDIYTTQQIETALKQAVK